MTQAIDSVVAERNAPAQGVSAEDRRRFERTFAEDGYVVFKNVVPRDQLSSLRQKIIGALDRLKQTGELFSGGGLISGHLNCYPGEASRFAFDAVAKAGIVDLASAKLPESRRQLRVSCNVNLPKSVAQHYHIDYSPHSEGFVIINVAVEDTDLVNGAIELAPGTHNKVYEYWRFAIERPHRRSKRISMSQGDVLVRGSHLWHRGMPNRAATPRPMLAFTIGEDVRPGDPFELDGGAVTFQPNWYRPSVLGRLRERTFVAAPVTYSAYRFVKSLMPSQRGVRL